MLDCQGSATGTLARILLKGALAVAMVAALSACDDDEVGDVSLGIFTTKDIKIEILQDPEVPGVTCHISSIEANLQFSDPSDMSIACRQTGEITSEMVEAIDKSKSGDIVFRKSKSVFFKSLKIRRVLDQKSQSLMYIAYSTKETSGSYKHSLSTVPLWGTKAYGAFSQPAG